MINRTKRDTIRGISTGSLSWSRHLPLLLLAAVLTLWQTKPGFCDEEFTHYHIEIEFRHYIHTEGQGIACTICHTQLKSGSYTMLGHNACISCHTQHIDVYEISDETCGVCHPNLEGNGSQVKVTLSMNKPPRGIFLHSQYLENICYVCHGAMLDEVVELGKIKSDQEIRRIREISHRFHFANSCERCHREMTKEQAPENHENDWKNQHRTVAPSFNCRICHQKSFCQSCHDDVY